MKIDNVNPFATQMASYVQSSLDGVAAGTSFGDALAQAVAQAAPHKADEGAPPADTPPEEDGPTLIERIRDKGFVAFVEDLQEEKLKELRKKILASMGYTEEDLKAMSPEQRAQVEDIVDNEIIKRMMALAALKGDDQGGSQGGQMMGIVQKTQLNVRVTNVSMQATTVQFGTLQAGSMGLGPLLAHQEIEDDQAVRGNLKTQHETQRQTGNMTGKKDREEVV